MLLIHAGKPQSGLDSNGIYLTYVNSMEIIVCEARYLFESIKT